MLYGTVFPARKCVTARRGHRRGKIYSLAVYIYIIYKSEAAIFEIVQKFEQSCKADNVLYFPALHFVGKKIVSELVWTTAIDS